MIGLNAFASRLGLAGGAAALWLALGATLCGQIRDGGIDPSNLGKGEWIYSMTDATNKLGGHVSSVTNEASLMLWYKSQGIRYIIVKAATSDQLFKGCYSTPQFTSRLANIAHTNGILIFGYNRSYGSNIVGEVGISDYVFQQGADGFVWDAEAEWEATYNTNGLPNHPWITNGSAQAWQLCSTVRSNWPTKFLAHAPFPIISVHSSFPYKEFGYWCDTVMPQIYHFSSGGIQQSPSAAINWSDVNWRNWQNNLQSLPPANLGGLVVYWTNSIKPLAPVQDVYGPSAGGVICEGTASAFPDEDVMEFIDYLSADPNVVTASGYKGASFWRTDLHGSAQWANIKAGSSGDFSNIVNNIVMDDANASVAGGWTAVRTFAATQTAPTYYGATGSDTNSFGTNYFVKGQGIGAAFVEFRPRVMAAGDYKVYQWHPYRADASTNAPFLINHDGGSTIVYANQQTNAGNWSLLGRFAFAAGTGATVRVTDAIPETNRVALADGLKLVFVPPTSVPAIPTGLVATAVSISQINLAWTDNATNETAYIVARSTASGGPYTNIATLPANATTYTNAGLPPSTTYYYAVRTTNYLGASANSSPASATTQTPAPPTITTQPQSQSVNQGGAVAFTVSTTGTEPFHYAWRFNGANIPGATNTTYSATNVTPSRAGTYTVVITNPYGSTTSNPALLVVNVPPSITAQPQSQTVKTGSNATFSVFTAGTAPFGYQWQFNGSNLPGATSSTYTRLNAQTSHAGNYSVLVTNVAGWLTSSNAVLTILLPQPAHFESIRFLPPDQRVQLIWSGEPGATYIVEGSSNVVNWSQLGTVTSTNGTFQFVDGPAPANGRVFYRLLSP